MLYSSCCLRLRTSPRSEGGEGCECWNQLNHLILEAHTRNICVQSLLDPLPGCESIHIIILKEWAAILLHSFCTSILSFASGGDQNSSVLSGASNSFTISKLRESSAYKIQVSAMVGKREGNPALVTARTCEWPTVQRIICVVLSFVNHIMELLSLKIKCCTKDTMFLNVSVDLPKVNGFVALNTTESSIVLNWTQVSGVSGYLLTWRHISGQKSEEQVLDLAVWMLWWEERGWRFQTINGFFFLVLETKSQRLGPSFSSHKITNLLRGRTYIFTIRPLYAELEGPISTVYHKIGKTLEKWFESWELFWGSRY